MYGIFILNHSLDVLGLYCLLKGVYMLAKGKGFLRAFW